MQPSPPDLTSTAASSEDAAGALDDERVLVEGETAAQALEEVHRLHGEGARIVQAEKVRRGGVGGFFAKELVQLTVVPAAATERADADRVAADVAAAVAAAAAPDARPASSTAPTTTASSAVRAVTDDAHAGETFGELLDRRAADAGPAGGLAGVVAELTRATDHRESTFGDALRSALGPAPASRRPTPRPQHASTRAAAPAGDTLVRTPPHLLDPRLATGAMALADGAEQVPADAPTIARAAPASGAGGGEMEHAEAALDAAVRAVSAGTTAETVLRAAEAGTATRFEPLALGAAPAPTAPSSSSAPRVAATAPVAAAEATRPDDGRARGGAVATELWSEDGLARLGLPDVLVRTIVGQQPHDDLSWFTAVARAVEPLCSTGADAAAIHVGPHARRVARATGATVATLSRTAPRSGSLVLACTPSERALQWLDRGRRGRELHLVVGGDGWRDWVWQEPQAVTWSAPEFLADALGVAVQLGLRLSGTPDGERFLAATPVAVAIAVRELLER